MTTHGETVLPELPELTWRASSDERIGQGGFLALRRVALVLPHGEQRQSVVYDIVERAALDACVIVAHETRDGIPWVWLRTCIRPPLALRPRELAPHTSAVGWEIPAGLIEATESPIETASRELLEELGFEVTARDVEPLGSWTVPAPGFIAEVHHFFHVRVDGLPRHEPAGDGSPLEADATFACIPLERALAACRAGEIRDAKTELGLRRLADLVSNGG